MNFLNPLILIGLVAAGIPLLLHLLNLRKLKTVDFSTLKFIKELQKTKIRKLKLKQILLLILRTLIIIFAVLAFARPTIEGSLPFFESYAKSSVVIIVDNSFSMDISDEYGNRLNQAKNAVRALMQNMNEGDEIALFEMANNQFDVLNTFATSTELIESNLNNIKITPLPAQLDNSLKFAQLILEDAKNLNKEIFIISDFQSNVFETAEFDSIKMKDPSVSFFLIPVGANSKASLNNLSIDSLNLLSSIFVPNRPVEVEAYIRNSSNTDIKGAVVSMMYNDQRVAQRAIDVPAGKSIAVAIAAPPQNRGPIKSTIMTENDVLDYDNTNFFGFHIPESPRILIAGEATDVFFIENVLRASDEKNENSLTVVSPQLFASQNLTSFDLVILAGGDYARADFDRISQYVENGGAAMVFPVNVKNMSDMSYFTSKLGLGNSTEIVFEPSKPGRFTIVESSHPIFDNVFKKDESEAKNVESPKIYRAVKVYGGRTIIKSTDGVFFVENEVGEGKVYYFGVKPTTQWSDFPFVGIFPALIHRSMILLTSSSDKAIESIIGSSANIIIPKRYAGTNRFRIVDPNGNEFFRDVVNLPSGAVVSLENMTVKGLYQIFDEKGNFITQIAVNHNSTESEITKPDMTKISGQVQTRLLADNNLNIIEDIDEIDQGLSQARVGTELWQIFLLLTLITAVIEMIISRVTKNEQV
ncbi:MAG: hypothetical protein CVV22_09865 [Ignavibacteriae bacterium HGW-Ignavibacteriae-1]|nr:MAG: hypothetical protein CVV22_09865 [Ignavibacteriae bacterium HGW-Ignavibacteriae-1]